MYRKVELQVVAQVLQSVLQAKLNMKQPRNCKANVFCESVDMASEYRKIEH
jgi:hypothetical protein